MPNLPQVIVTAWKFLMFSDSCLSTLWKKKSFISYWLLDPAILFCFFFLGLKTDEQEQTLKKPKTAQLPVSVLVVSAFNKRM